MVSILEVPRSGYGLLKGRAFRDAEATIILSSAALSALSGPGEAEPVADNYTPGCAVRSRTPQSQTHGHGSVREDSQNTEIIQHTEVAQQHAPSTDWVASTGTIIVIGRAPQPDLADLSKPAAPGSPGFHRPPATPPPQDLRTAANPGDLQDEPRPVTDALPSQ